MQSGWICITPSQVVDSNEEVVLSCVYLKKNSIFNADVLSCCFFI